MIELTAEEEARLAEAAARRGMSLPELAREALNLVTHLHAPRPVTEPEDPTLALFARWDAEDAALTPEQIAEAQREYEQFRDSLNAERDRAGARRVL